MSILQIELPEEQLQLINEQARAHGYDDSGKYLASVAGKLARHKEILVEPKLSSEQLTREERLLLQVLNDERPSIVATPALWAQLRDETKTPLGEK